MQQQGELFPETLGCAHCDDEPNGKWCMSWYRMRMEIAQMQGGHCALCNGAAQQLHHTNYDAPRTGHCHELPVQRQWLVVLCNHHHELLTWDQRKQRREAGVRRQTA